MPLSVQLARRAPCRSSIHRLAFSTAPLVAALTLGLSASAAQAGSFGVQVVDAAGDAVAGASVCIGLPGNYSQFGALFTDAQGRASAEVPNVPLVVTVSKTRFAAVRMTEPARGFNLIKQVVLSDGAQPGPRCRTDSSLAAPGIGLSVDAVAVQRTDGVVRLDASTSGSPTHYRLSRSAGFEGSSWQAFDALIAVPAALEGAGEIYLQLRRYEGGDTGWLEARSTVVTVRLQAGLS